MGTKHVCRYGIVFTMVVVLCAAALQATEPVEKEVNWTGPSGSRIRQVRMRPEAIATEISAMKAAGEVAANVIDSPPIDGFVPWIVITTTNRRLSEEVWDAVPESSYIGMPTPANPQTDYAIGIFDTGASANVFGYGSAVTLGLWNSTYLTDNVTTISGVTGSVDAWVSYPFGVFMGGLNALDPNGMSHVVNPQLTNTGALVGESNVAVIIGDDPGSYPDLATAIGSPMSVFYTAHIRNDLSVTVEKGGETFAGPPISFFDDPQDPSIPEYPIRVPLELRPMGATGVQYIPFDIEDIFNFEYTPSSPSVIIGSSSQSLFFVHSVDLAEGTYSAVDKSRFMLDTGAQVTVIGSRIAARLGLDEDAWEFEVDIEGVTGEVTQAPGYFLDSLKIPALGEWLEFTNVPVILLDIFSPEGGTLDGIIGMNLFTEYNLVLRGGGLFLTNDPVLELQRIGSLTADMAPAEGDGQVDLLDLAVLGQAWQSTSGSAGWNARADLVSDQLIDLQDLAVFCGQWLTAGGY